MLNHADGIKGALLAPFRIRAGSDNAVLDATVAEGVATDDAKVSFLCARQSEGEIKCEIEGPKTL